MKTIPLNDHELPLTDFSNFELRLKEKGAHFTCTHENWTSPTGMTYIRLTGSAVEFEETLSSEEDIGRLLELHGFQKKSG